MNVPDTKVYRLGNCYGERTYKEGLTLGQLQYDEALGVDIYGVNEKTHTHLLFRDVVWSAYY